MTKSRSLSRQITIVTGIVSTAVIIFTSITFSMAYYFLVQHDSRSILVKEASEIIQEHVTFSQGKLALIKNPPGETLAVKLQNFNLSAILLDTSLTPIVSYGIYQNLPETKNLSDYISIPILNAALTTNKISLSTQVVPGKITYETLVLPIDSNSKSMGVLVLSRPYEFINNLLQLNLIVLAFSVPLSLILGWVLSVTTIKSSFMPLNKLVDYLKQIQYTSDITKLEFKEDPGLEISSLTNAFNDMVSRVGESLNKQKNFVAHASHELKTPLTQAISSLELAEATSDPKYITHLKEELMSLNNILDSLLIMSKISSPTPQSPAMEITISPIISEIIQLYQKAINQKKLELHINIPPTAKIQFPPEHFRILVSNLISNAIKYNITSGKITINWVKNTLVISDTGIGMNPEERDHMFDRFYRGKNTSSSVKGTGLGLALVKLIIDQHRLDISVTSAPQKGTAVSVTFPKA